jgi:hypothetical protein
MILELDVQREETLKKLEELSSLLKDPDSLSEGLKPTKRYTLRGAAIADENYFDTTYVLLDPPVNSENENTGDIANDHVTDEAAENSTDQAMADTSSIREQTEGQWWKGYYSSTPWVSQTKVLKDAVIKAASEESRDVLLVYANDEAVEPRDCALPATLQSFIETDNAFFNDELEESRVGETVQPDFNMNVSSWDDDDDPPAYDSINDVRWPAHDRNADDRKAGGDSWTPDPGSALVADNEYRVNTEYDYKADMSANSAPASTWDGTGAFTNDEIMESIESDNFSQNQSQGQSLQSAGLGHSNGLAGHSSTSQDLMEPSGSSLSRQSQPLQSKEKGSVKHIEDVDMQP